MLDDLPKTAIREPSPGVPHPLAADTVDPTLRARSAPTGLSVQHAPVPPSGRARSFLLGHNPKPVRASFGCLTGLLAVLLCYGALLFFFFRVLP